MPFDPHSTFRKVTDTSKTNLQKALAATKILGKDAKKAVVNGLDRILENENTEKITSIADRIIRQMVNHTKDTGHEDYSLDELCSNNPEIERHQIELAIEMLAKDNYVNITSDAVSDVGHKKPLIVQVTTDAIKLVEKNTPLKFLKSSLKWFRDSIDK